jgi:ABC-type nickel/cobalt efflux system permease component RcnA
MAIYFLPRNTEISDTEKWLTIGAAYLIVALLWWVLRKKEKLMEQRNKDIENTYKK